MKCEMWIRHQVKNSTLELGINLEKVLVISHIAEAKEVDVIEKGGMVRRQRRKIKEHAENPTPRGSAEDKVPGGGSKGRN